MEQASVLWELWGQNAKQAGEFGVKSKSGRLKMKNGFLF